MYTTKHKLHTARNDNDWVVWIFVISYYCCYFFLFHDQHTNKRKQRIKVERHEEKSLSILPSLRWDIKKNKK